MHSGCTFTGQWQGTAAGTSLGRERRCSNFLHQLNLVCKSSQDYVEHRRGFPSEIMPSSSNGYTTKANSLSSATLSIRSQFVVSKQNKRLHTLTLAPTARRYSIPSNGCRGRRCTGQALLSPQLTRADQQLSLGIPGYPTAAPQKCARSRTWQPDLYDTPTGGDPTNA